MLAPHRGGRVTLATLVALAVACGSSSKSASERKLHVPSPAWEDQVIYFVMTDRFANGDPSNDDQGRGEFDPSSQARYSGGDLQGIIDRLDYIQGLGATAIWITPPVANLWWDPLQQFGGYHGYWARDLKKVDEHLGTLDTYRALSDALHRRGMYLIQDVVPNHMGNFITYASYDPADPTTGFVKNEAAMPASRPEQPPFDQNDVTDPAQREAAIYHWTPAIADYLDPHQELNYQISDLDDLNTENPVVREALRDSYGYWIREVGVDAFRVDTAKFAPHAFWNDFMHSEDPAAPGMLATARATGREKFHAFGEVFEVSAPLDDAGERKVGSFHGTAAAPELPGVLQFPLYEEIGRVFAGGEPTAQLRYRLEKFMDPAFFPNPHTTPTFLDNHDVRRFLTIGTPNGLAQALAFLFTIPGIPVVYYGTEQHFTENRGAMFAGGYLTTVDLFRPNGPSYQRIKKLADLRKSDPVFRRGALEVLYDNPAGAGALAYRRTHEGRSALVLLNTADEPVLVAGLDSKLPAGSVLEVLHAEANPGTPAVGAGGQLSMVLPARAALIARPTGATVAPPAPAATITVTTPVDGQTFTGDVTVSGTVSPPTTRLQVVLDDYVGRAADVEVRPDGTWSAIVPVSLFPAGAQPHALTFWAPDAQVASPRMRFTSDVVFDGAVIDVPDPEGDDTGPAGTYAYPQNPTFGGAEMDVTGVTLEVGATTMNFKITMADWSTVWNPPLGFDHVAFNVYFALPGAAGVTVMPKLNASTPDGFSWSYQQFAYGWDTTMYTSQGATATTYGAPTRKPVVKTAPGNTVIFTYDRTAFGLDSWSGVRVYLTTWDYDGIGASFRGLSPAGGEWEVGGGAATDPMIMDAVGPIAIP
jgi:glycosidase